jgi:hypothetical protein
VRDNIFDMVGQDMFAKPDEIIVSEFVLVNRFVVNKRAFLAAVVMQDTAVIVRDQAGMHRLQGKAVDVNIASRITADGHCAFLDSNEAQGLALE